MEINSLQLSLATKCTKEAEDLKEQILAAEHAANKDGWLINFFSWHMEKK